jgi:hypothetical protein
MLIRILFAFLNVYSVVGHENHSLDQNGSQTEENSPSNKYPGGRRPSFSEIVETNKTTTENIARDLVYPNINTNISIENVQNEKDDYVTQAEENDGKKYAGKHRKCKKMMSPNRIDASYLNKLLRKLERVLEESSVEIGETSSDQNQFSKLGKPEENLEEKNVK